MKTIALIGKGKDGTFGVFTPYLKSTIIGEGNTVAEAKADFLNSVNELMLYYKETGKQIPEELIDIEFEFKFDMSEFLLFIIISLEFLLFSFSFDIV